MIFNLDQSKTWIFIIKIFLTNQNLA